MRREELAVSHRSRDHRQPNHRAARSALLQAASTCNADIILATAFPDRSIYRRFAHAIAWETEVWIADAPEHMIHFNGDKFLGPYKQKAD